jgi:hypothetical protein
MPDWQMLRPALNHLQWGKGLTRDEMMSQSPDLRVKLMRLLPGDYCFPNADSVFSYFAQLEREGRLELPSKPPPGGYPPASPTGVTFPAHRTEPSVGSGSGSGTTGSSAQTGVGRWGTSDHQPGT